jgi:hypothetical protein
MILFALLCFSTQLSAALNYDLSDVDPASSNAQRYLKWGTGALNGRPPYAFAASDAVNLYLIFDDPDWCDLATTMVDESVALAETKMAAGTRPDISGDSYLHVGGDIASLSLTYDKCPQVTPEQKQRWAAYAEQAVWNVWNFSQATWGGKPFPWSGWSILHENPGNNYYFSFIAATMYWGFVKDPGVGVDWINELKTNRIPKIIAYYQQNGVGGGSREGTGYGVAQGALFRLYALWLRNTGQNLADESTHLRDSIDYWIHATVPNLTYYAPIGDLSRVSFPYLYDSHRSYMLAAMHMAPPEYASRAAWWLTNTGIRTGGGGYSFDRMTRGENLSNDLLPITAEPVAPTALHYYSPGAGHFFARSDWTKRATWISFIAGIFDESHAHQDQGSFQIFRDDWLAVDENIYSHSGTIGTVQSGPNGIKVHNMLRFERNGVPANQLYQHGTTATVTPQENGVQVSADLSPFYAATSGVKSWSRELSFANNALDVQDVFTVDSDITAIWQLNTPVEPVIEGNSIRAGGLLITPVVPLNPDMTITDWREFNTEARPNEYKSGWLIELRGGVNAYTVRLETEASRN